MPLWLTYIGVDRVDGGEQPARVENEHYGCYALAGESLAPKTLAQLLVHPLSQRRVLPPKEWQLRSGLLDILRQLPHRFANKLGLALSPS